LSNAGFKLQEAEYFLNQMKSHATGSMDYRFHLNAFLTSARSVLDVLLYDYGMMYGLFTLNDRVNPQDFQKLATGRGNTTAMNFYSWWTTKTGSVANDPVGGFLSKQRNISVHRGQPAMNFTLILPETISFHSGLVFNPPSVTAGSPGPNAIDVTTAKPSNHGSATPTPAPSPPPRQATTASFAGYPSASATDICEKYLQMLSSIVTEARTAFPLT